RRSRGPARPSSSRCRTRCRRGGRGARARWHAGIRAAAAAAARAGRRGWCLSPWCQPVRVIDSRGWRADACRGTDGAPTILPMGRTSETPHKPPHPSHLPQGTGRQRASTPGTDVQRERILQAAARLFAAQGYANTTMAQIVRELGVSKPFVYYYFRDKQEIFETLSWRPAVDCFTALDFAATDPRRASQKVMQGIEGLIRATIAHHPVAFFAYREPQVYRPEYLEAQKKLAHHFYDLLC